MELVETMQPDWYEALSDADTDGNSSKKRVSKSLSKSTAYINQCLNLHKKSQVLCYYHLMSIFYVVFSYFLNFLTAFFVWKMVFPRDAREIHQKIRWT